MEEKVKEALRTHGANAVAKVLGISREAAMSLALGIESRGTRALAAPNVAKLETLGR
jgi:hypothetical protein